MKNKSLKVVLLCAISSFVLAGCANPLSKLTNKSDSEEATEIVEEQQVVHLNNVTAGTVIDNETLISYAMSLSGESDIASAICSTETETNLTELVLEEGIHTVTISYTKSDGSTGETQMTYKADPATEEQVEDTVEVEDGTEAEDTEEQSESIPIEGRIYLINQAINTVDSLDEYSMSEDIDKDSLVYTKDLSIELNCMIFASMHLRKLNGNRRPTMDDLKDSNTLEYELDACFLVYNDVSKNKQGAKIFYRDSEESVDKKPIIEVDWGKNKISAYKGVTFCNFAPDYSKCIECSEDAAMRYNALIYEV